MTELDIGVQQAPGDKLIRLQLMQADINSRPQRLREAVAQAEDIRKYPQFAGDVDILTVESHVLVALGLYNQAYQATALALQAAPNNASLIRDEMQILLLNSDYSGLNTAADNLLAAVTAKDKAWWMYDYRAIARAHLNNTDLARDDMKLDLGLAHDDPDLAVMQVATQDLCTHVGAGDVQAYLATMPPDDLRWKLALAVADMAAPDTKSRAADAARQLASSADLDKLKDDQKVFALRVAESAYLATKPPMQQDAADIDRRILKILPDDVVTLNNLANRLVGIDPKGNLKDALTYSSKAVDILQKAGRTDPHVIDTLGWIQLLSGSYNQAISTLQPVYSSTPDLSICIHLATAYAKLSQPLQAKVVIERAHGIIDLANQAKQSVDPDLKAQLDDVQKTVDSLSAAKADAASP
jgi:tetratricopeptide (TPR) repeat protein